MRSLSRETLQRVERVRKELEADASLEVVEVDFDEDVATCLVVPLDGSPSMLMLISEGLAYDRLHSRPH